MNGTAIGVDLNGIVDSWTLVETSDSPVFIPGASAIPPVVITPQSRGETPLAGMHGLQALDGRGWLWPEEAKGPDENGRCRRIPVIHLLEFIAKGQKEVEADQGNFFSISELIASHLSSLNIRRASTAVVAIPDTADETFQQRILDSRYNSGFEKLMLLWRPVATLLAWGQHLDQEQLQRLEGTNALAIYLGALGIEASVMKLDLEKSVHGPLLTPVRSSSGTGDFTGQFRVLDLAQQFAQNLAMSLQDQRLAWQMLWSSPFVWKRLLGYEVADGLFQKSNGEFIGIHAPEPKLDTDDLESFADSFEEILDDFDDSQLVGVRNVVISGHFLRLSLDKNENLGAILARIVRRRTSNSTNVHILTNDKKSFLKSDPVAEGAAIYAWRLSQGLPTYYDFLPQLEINATVRDQPDFVALVPKKSRIPGGQAFGPYTVQQPFTIPAGTPDLKFYIYKEGDQVRTMLTPLKEPLIRETPVKLVVRQTPGQGHAIVEVHPDQTGVFGSRVLTLNWESLDPTQKDKTQILNDLKREAGICYPELAPVITHEKMWSAVSAHRDFEDYLNVDFDTRARSARYLSALSGLSSAVNKKRRGSTIGLRDADSTVFSAVSSDGTVPDIYYIDETLFYENHDRKLPQHLLTAAMKKLALEFDICNEQKTNFPNKKGIIQKLFLTSAWCYVAAPDNVREYLLDYISNVERAGVQAEAVSRCINQRDHLLRFFSILENHCDGRTYNHKWVKALTQILQFREDAAQLLSESQSLKFTLMALNVIGMEMDAKNLKVKFLWGLQLLMLLFRYRMKRKDFLKSDSPQYAQLHENTRSILSNAIEVTKSKNRKAKTYIQETLKMLDYRGTNQLIARELASDMISSKESEEADNLQEDEQFIRKDRDSSRISVEDSLKAFQQAINARTIEQSEPGHAKPPTLTDIDPFTRVHSSPTRQQPVFNHSDQQDSQVAPSNYGGTEIPLPSAIKIPLLSAINNVGGETKLYDAAETIAAHFGMPLREFQQNRFSTVRNRLLEAMQQAALILSSEGCIERSSGLLWKITDKGIQELKRLSTNQVGLTKATQLDFTEKTLTKKPVSELPLRQRKQNAETEQIVEYDPSEIRVPSGSQIKIPLLRIIRQMGGRAEISKVLPYIGRHFKIPVKDPMKGNLTPLAADLLKKTKYAAKLLWYDNYLELLNSNTWRMTATGTEFLESCKNRGLGDFSETTRSEETSQAISKLPNTPPHKELASTSVAESKLNLKADKIASEDAVKNKETESSPSGSIEIPLSHRIRIPLLFIMYKLGGEIELYQAMGRIAESFDIPASELGKTPFSSVEKKLFEAMQESAKLLWKINFIERSRPGFWKITVRGINWLKSSGKLD